MVTTAEAAKQSNPKWLELFRIYLSWLSRSLYTMYCWSDLPETMDGRALERALIQDGVAGLYDHPMYGQINLRATWGELGIYGIPEYSDFYSISNDLRITRVNVGKSSENGVLVLNNSDGEGYYSLAIVYAQRLADISIAHGVNVDAQKTPILIDGDYIALEQLVKMYMTYAGGSPVIPSRTSQNKRQAVAEGMGQGLKVLKTDAPFVADKLYQQFLSILHEFYSLVGINYANNQKSERMLVSEVNANNQEVMLSIMSGLYTRREAAKQYNRIHGTNIQVHLSVDPFTGTRLEVNNDEEPDFIGSDEGEIRQGDDELPDRT